MRFRWVKIDFVDGTSIVGVVPDTISDHQLRGIPNTSFDLSFSDPMDAPRLTPMDALLDTGNAGNRTGGVH